MKVESKLNAAALGALARAYAPYSKLRVGAAIETRSRKIFAGCNVENASLGLSICAERAAVCAAVAAGEADFVKIAIVTSTGRPTAPCGACRQVLAEFSPDVEIVMIGLRETESVMLNDLLPRAFGREGK